MKKNLNKTTLFSPITTKNENMEQDLKDIEQSLIEKGYNPIIQIVGYLLSGDPTYITSHNDARNKIRKYYKDEILEEIIKKYLESIKIGDN